MRACDWCTEPIGPMDAQTIDSTGTWHTRCRNAMDEFQRMGAQEFEDAPPAAPRVAPWLAGGGK